MMQSAAGRGAEGYAPESRIHIYHPDSRAMHAIPLHVLTDRLERALDVAVKARWLPTLVAMADGLFMSPECIQGEVTRLTSGVGGDAKRARRQVPDVLEQLCEHSIIEKQSVESLYRLGRLEELNHPRVWEINGWWEKLYGVIPARSEFDDEPDLDLWEDGLQPALEIGKTSLPIGMEPERDEIRLLMEKKLLSQYEFLYRLRLSWHRS